MKSGLLLLCLLFAAAGSRNGLAQTQCPASPMPRIEIIPAFPKEIVYNTNLTDEEFKKLTDEAEMTHEGEGVTLAFIRSDSLTPSDDPSVFSFDIVERKRSASYCFYVRSITHKVGYKSFVMFAPKSLADNPSGQREIFAHEKLHANVRMHAVRESVPLLKERWESLFRRGGPLASPSPNEYPADFLQSSYVKLTKAVHGYASKQSKKIDTDESYLLETMARDEMETAYEQEQEQAAREAERRKEAAKHSVRRVYGASKETKAAEAAAAAREAQKAREAPKVPAVSAKQIEEEKNEEIRRYRESLGLPPGALEGIDRHPGNRLK